MKEKIRIRSGQKKMSQLLVFALFSLILSLGIVSCKNDSNGADNFKVESADAGKPTVMESFSPDSGGIATPMLIRGSNFGTDTSKLHVYFKNNKVRERASVIRSNGSVIYLVVPKHLTYQRELDIEVEVTVDGEKTPRKVMEKNNKKFIYKTETTLTTVAGQVFEDAGTAVTKGGTLSESSFSAPMFLCVDDEKNVIIIERNFQKANAAKEMDMNFSPKDVDKVASGGHVLMLNEESNSVVLVKKAGAINAPAVSPDGKSIYVPEDAGLGYLLMKQSEGYAPRPKAIKGDNSLTNSNWKFSFVTKAKDPTLAVDTNAGMIYSVMYKKQLIKIDPITDQVEQIATDVDYPEGSDVYLAFSTKNPNMLYLSVTNQHSIYRMDVTKDTVATPYAGGAVIDLPKAEAAAWADGPLDVARFRFPRQITFDASGVLYVADCRNHCIRTIDTESDVAPTVTTILGFPGDKGNVDGGPDLAKLNSPIGIAKAFDGTIYIADTQNFIIRKLAVQ